MFSLVHLVYTERLCVPLICFPRIQCLEHSRWPRSALRMPGCRVPSSGAHSPTGGDGVGGRGATFTQNKRQGGEYHMSYNPVLSLLQKLWGFGWVVGGWGR